MKANLHIHSNYSDGTKSIKDINDLAIKNNVDVISITDHDTLDSINDIDDLKTSVRFIYGIEMSAKYKNEVIHILGYFNNKPDKSLVDYFSKLSIKNYERIRLIINNLKKYYNIEILYENVRARADGIINSSHIAMEICDKYNIEFQEVYDNYLGYDKKAYVKNDCINLEDAICLLKENKAVIVLAHPKLIKTFDFKEILNLGFDGIEVYHPEHNEEYVKMLIGVANNNNLIVTGGSDYHGDILNYNFDEKLILDEDIEKFLNVLEKKVIKNVRK